ncbi:MAG TPA: YidC/Oxa1 family membrane protein insertase [Acidimicrobiia bacterium]|jgi:YidC/Oxa1 family membrane protein insertase|nr:YidC/Oxa1 family membrane protein insertase [Acidimicrobiia bacterium]HIL45776.1 YidC/Oxa1 family membrane protein insertase [Acidimicrobiia bacterium]
MFDLIASLLAWFYELVPSYGLSIVLLTMVVMVVVTPLTLKGTRSMIKMQHMQPEMKKIQNRYKGDREKMNKEMMAFYQANGINPMGGCLPMFIQMPVFIVLYNVLRGLTRRLSDVGESAGWIAGRLASGKTATGVLDEPSVFFPDYISSGSKLFEDLSNTTEMIFLGFDLSRSASDALSESLMSMVPYLVLMLLVFVSSWYQQKQIRGRSTGQAVNPQQQMIMKVMPFFLPMISYSLDAALVLYFVISNIYRIAQQSYITRTLYGPGQDKPVVVQPEPNASAKVEKAGKKPNNSQKQGKNSSNSEPIVSQGSAVKRNRTTAGNNKNSSQNKNEKRQIPSEKQKDTDPKVKRRRFGRQKDAEQNEENDQKPPSARKGGGRTTPSGTAQPGGSHRKKNKKKRK